MALKIESGRVTIGGKIIIDQFSVQTEAATLFFVVGKNGSGKTSLLRSLAGLAPFRLEGSISQTQPLQLNAPSFPKLSILESETTIPYSMTTEELVTLAGKDQAESLIKLFELSEFWKRNVLELSSGERQRALIAHALNTDAQIILLDEPLNHLDWDEKIKTLEKLAAWTKAYNVTILATIHDLDLIKRFSLPCWLVGQKTVSAFQDPAALFRSPQFKAQFTFTDSIRQT